MVRHGQAFALRVIPVFLCAALLQTAVLGQGAWRQTKLDTVPAQKQRMGDWSYQHEGDFGDHLMTGRTTKHVFSYRFQWTAPPAVLPPDGKLTVPISVELAGKQVPPGSLLCDQGIINVNLEILDTRGEVWGSRSLYDDKGNKYAKVTGCGALGESRSVKVSAALPGKPKPEHPSLRVVVAISNGMGEITFLYRYRYEWRGSPSGASHGGAAWEGAWATDFGSLRLQVKGGRVTGTYTSDNGRIEGTLSEDGSAIKGTWSEAPSYAAPKDAGTFRWVLSEDGASFTGNWGYGDGPRDRPWAGRRE